MNAEELNQIVNDLLDSPDYKNWLNAFPINLDTFKGSEVEKQIVARLLSGAITTHIEIESLALMFPKFPNKEQKKK